jgi:hypothetical protein
MEGETCLKKRALLATASWKGIPLTSKSAAEQSKYAATIAPKN